ncbi:MAG: phosphoribosylanthranilate isomerase [Candidatus Omnitrophica bacterium]|nr:phosphoribosylanthranilate isomerase [Candidatus Omnitrophota bacterium]
MRVKVCGITNHEDAQKAAYYGAWAVGFIFHKKSPRYISPSKARKLIEALPPFITPVGVFVDLSERAVREVCNFTRIKTVQFHGKETAQYCKRFKDCKIIKAFKIAPQFDFGQIKEYMVDAYLFDTFKEGIEGGTGTAFNWEMLKGQKFDKPIILSGGITVENVRQAVEAVNPYAIDVSSSLEKSPGIKDARKIRAFFDVLNFRSPSQSEIDEK